MAAVPVQLKSKTSKALGELLNLARAGQLHGLAYSIIKEDDDGGLSAGSNVIWNGDTRIEKALGEVVTAMKDRMDKASPKSRLILPN